MSNYNMNWMLKKYADFIRDPDNVTKDEIIGLKNDIVDIYDRVCRDCPDLLYKRKDGGNFKWYGDTEKRMSDLFELYNNEYGSEWKIRLKVSCPSDMMASQPSISWPKLSKFSKMIDKVEGLILPPPGAVHPDGYRPRWAFARASDPEKLKKRTDMGLDGHTRMATYFINNQYMNERGKRVIPSFQFVLKDKEAEDDVARRMSMGGAVQMGSPYEKPRKISELPVSPFWDDNGIKEGFSPECGPLLRDVKELYVDYPDVLDLTDHEQIMKLT